MISIRLLDREKLEKIAVFLVLSAFTLLTSIRLLHDRVSAPPAAVEYCSFRGTWCHHKPVGELRSKANKARRLERDFARMVCFNGTPDGSTETWAN